MKKKINLPLVFLTIVIWSFILYTIAETLLFNSETQPEDSSVQNSDYIRNYKITDNDPFRYEQLEKDPFSLQKKAKNKPVTTSFVKKSPEVIEQTVNDESIIQFNVSGVIINTNNKNVIFKDITNNEVIFLKEGDEYKGLIISKINKEKVEIVDKRSGKLITSELN